MSADMIVVVEKGKIIEKGSHEQLILEKGRYADLWSKQAFLKPHKYTDDGDKKLDSSNIVNDISVDETTAQLSKVKPQSGHDGTGQLED